MSACAAAEKATIPTKKLDAVGTPGAVLIDNLKPCDGRRKNSTRRFWSIRKMTRPPTEAADKGPSVSLACGHHRHTHTFLLGDSKPPGHLRTGSCETYSNIRAWRPY